MPKVLIFGISGQDGAYLSQYLLDLGYKVYGTSSDAVIHMVSDLQDPPEMIRDLIYKWEEGYKLVIGVKTKSEESFLFFGIRKFYYYLINKLSDTELVKNFTGFGLYDREVINALKKINDTYPYLRGLISELGYDLAKIEYEQPLRKKGLTKNNFYTLYDMAMLGFTSHSKVPLRLATFTGFLVSLISIFVGIFYFIYKLMFFERFDVGIAPLVVGLFFFGAVQLFFIGIIGEYIGSIHTQVLKRPLVIEKERVNFDPEIIDSNEK
mgnify:CR=1 FL=1|jgi:glycosyltransferase involved in cell wall biosynthesis|tara:strand:- start:4463 stop:5260 length:798 start_codon:yes stop_codon:yes gene_type:complete